ncbi:MAG: DUF2835 family protein [Granulosicoccus sp.]
MMPSCRFCLKIRAHDMEDYYRGNLRRVRVTADNGQSLSFPVAQLQPFVTHNGVSGRFEISFSDTCKFISLKKIGD